MELKNKLPDINSYYFLFKTTEWVSSIQKTKDELFESIQNSWYIITAYKDDILIGSGRIISDGILHAFIVDLIVSPDYQNHGIGTAILKKLIDKLKEKNIHDIQLFCAKDKKEFYRKNGFVERPDNAPGMQYKV